MLLKDLFDYTVEGKLKTALDTFAATFDKVREVCDPKAEVLDELGTADGPTNAKITTAIGEKLDVS